MQSIFVQGLPVLGQKMSDPWGSDISDLSVIHFVIFNWRMSNPILKTKFLAHTASLKEEEESAKNRLEIGSAWQYDEDEAFKAKSGKHEQDC